MARVYEKLNEALPGLIKAVYSQPVDKLTAPKITIRPLLLKGERRYQAENFENNKAFHKNYDDNALIALAKDELEGQYRQVLILSEKEGEQYVLRRGGDYKKSGGSPSLPMPGGEEGHNRAKNYILSEGEPIPALVDLGVFTSDFRVVRSRYDKYKQINRFVELIDHEFSKTGLQQISILDFGCGKSYLTFILYYYFTVKKGMKTTIIGYDLKSDVVQHCNEIAEKYGYDGLRFQLADVTKDELEHEKIDMVVTLHACDTATDYALYYALKRKVKYIFSVPCCQHEVNQSIAKAGDLDIFMEHGIIKERMSALLTDAVRAEVLKTKGYQVDLIEFVDFEHSPKNIMIRARYTGLPQDETWAKARALQKKYGFSHTLLDLTQKDTQA